MDSVERPRAAIGTFPYPHRTVEQVNADRVQELTGRYNRGVINPREERELGELLRWQR